MDKIEVVSGDIFNNEHANHMLEVLDAYMKDPMGGVSGLDDKLATKIIDGLKKQPNYLFFLAYKNNQIAGLANCFINFSTFKGMQLLNIHDFAVLPEYRGSGIGKCLMNKIIEYSKHKNFCKITLEVRTDNFKAQKLYSTSGFKDCSPPMFFWSLDI
jgi:ribosomal protein S18 acetylase RimI-like enzyme